MVHRPRAAANVSQDENGDGTSGGPSLTCTGTEYCPEYACKTEWYDQEEDKTHR
jgi:uncharacterized protein YodC (DUF2158 family)